MGHTPNGVYSARLSFYNKGDWSFLEILKSLFHAFLIVFSASVYGLVVSQFYEANGGFPEVNFSIEYQELLYWVTQCACSWFGIILLSSFFAFLCSTAIFFTSRFLIFRYYWEPKRIYTGDIK